MIQQLFNSLVLRVLLTAFKLFSIKQRIKSFTYRTAPAELQCSVELYTYEM